MVLFLSLCGKKGEQEPNSFYLNHADSVGYVGMNTCRSCHAEQFDSYIHTAMGLSFDSATLQKTSATFGSHALVYDSTLDLYYKPFWKNDQLFVKEFRLANGDTVHMTEQAIDYIIGSGHHTNSHLFSRNGYLFQAPITYYTQDAKWDLAPGFEKGFNSRFSRLIGMECLSCHNSLPTHVEGSVNKFEEIPLGISCERCHGPGELHVKMRLEGNVDTAYGKDRTIVHPGKLNPQLQMDLCQRCHLQGVAVLKPGKNFDDFKPGMELKEVMDIFLPSYDGPTDKFIMASQAQRLRMSACYIATESITCITCHDPHVSLESTSATFLNSSCNSCHTDGKECKEDIEVRKVVDDDCSSCHMPKSGAIDIPHINITDHRIQIPPAKEELEEIREYINRIAENRTGHEYKFTGLTNMIDPDCSSITMARGYMRYLEAFSNDKAIIDSIGYYLSKADDAGEDDWIKFYFLSGNDQGLISFVEQKKLDELGDAWSAYRVGQAYYNLKNFELSVVYFRQALVNMPLHYPFKLKLAASLLQTGELEEARGLIKEVLKDQPWVSEAHNNMGLLEQHVGAHQSAEEHFRKAIALDPDYTLARLNLVRLLAELRNKENAIKELTIILDQEPENEIAKGMMVDLLKK